MPHDGRNSELGKGLFTTGISGFTFVTLDKIAGPNRVGEIHADAAAAVDKLEKDGAPASLIEQLKIQLARLEPGSLTASPGNEIINFPGYIPGGGPSAWKLDARVGWKADPCHVGRRSGAREELCVYPACTEPLLLQGDHRKFPA